VVIVVNGFCTSPVNLKSLSLRNLNNCFTLFLTIESREVIGDTVRRTLGDVGLEPLVMIEGHVTFGILETQTVKLILREILGMFMRGTLILLAR